MTALGFPKTARLKRAAEFRRVREKGRSYHGRLMVVSVAASETPEATRVGIVTSRRVGKAVDRNRVRRKLREVVRMDRPAFSADRWVVIVARHQAATAGFAELREDWRELAMRAGLLKREG